MPEFLKSKIGIFMVGIYLCLIFYVLIEINNSPPHSMNGIALLILTAPFSILLTVIFDYLGLASKDNDPFLYLYFTFGGLMNCVAIYLIGCLFTKTLNFFLTSQKAHISK